MERHCIHIRRHKSRNVQGKSCDQQGFGTVKHGGTLKVRTETSKLLFRATGKDMRDSDSKITTGPKNFDKH